MAVVRLEQFNKSLEQYLGLACGGPIVKSKFISLAMIDELIGRFNGVNEITEMQMTILAV